MIALLPLIKTIATIDLFICLLTVVLMPFMPMMRSRSSQVPQSSGALAITVAVQIVLVGFPALYVLGL